MRLNDSQLFREQCFIDGRWVPADSGATLEVDDPATGARLGSVPRAGAGETRRAIEAAGRALPDWRDRTARERGLILRRWFDAIMAAQADLAQIMTAEQGKPLAEAAGEVAYAASFIEWFAEEGKRIYGDTIPRARARQAHRGAEATHRRVRGDHAVELSRGHARAQGGPALAAGCTMVMKPASQTPYSALALCVLAERAGLPPGVLSCVTGSAQEIGGELTANPLVRKLSFTGSTEVGRQLTAACAATVKKVSMELGGNAPFIVFDDADLDAAVQGAIASKYRNAGQTCVCANRLLVQEGVYEAFAAKLVAAVQKLAVGPGAQPGIQIGPLIDLKAVAKVEEHINDALGKGAKVVTGGKRHALGGRFFEPTVLTGVTPAMLVAREETFGPLAPLFAFRTEDDAVRMANDTEFGLAAYFLHPRREPGVARGRGARIRHRRHQRRTHLNGSGAIRRREAERPRTRGVALWNRRLPRNQIPLPGRRHAARRGYIAGNGPRDALSCPPVHRRRVRALRTCWAARSASSSAPCCWSGSALCSRCARRRSSPNPSDSSRTRSRCCRPRSA